MKFYVWFISNHNDDNVWHDNRLRFTFNNDDSNKCMKYKRWEQ